MMNAIIALLHEGGIVLWVIMGVLLLLLFLFAERWMFICVEFKRISTELIERWLRRTDRCSWYAQAIREAELDRIEIELKRGFRLIRVLVMISPMLGLLGTVTGMVQIFNLLAWHGQLWLKFMESGIARATIPTFAGMVVSLVGLLLFNRLQIVAKRALGRLNDQMVRD